MAVVTELIRTEEDGSISFGNYEPVSYTHLTLYFFIGNCVPYETKPSGGSHCGVRNYVAKATRRRRRIP